MGAIFRAFPVLVACLLFATGRPLFGAGVEKISTSGSGVILVLPRTSHPVRIKVDSSVPDGTHSVTIRTEDPAYWGANNYGLFDISFTVANGVVTAQSAAAVANDFPWVYEYPPTYNSWKVVGVSSALQNGSGGVADNLTGKVVDAATFWALYDQAHAGLDPVIVEPFDISVSGKPCSSCDSGNCRPGDLDGDVGSVDLKIKLGRGMAASSIPAAFALHEETFNEKLWTRAGLVPESNRGLSAICSTSGLNGTVEGIEYISDGAGPRQILTGQALADIVTISGTKYEIRFYYYADRGTKNSATPPVYVPPGTAAPFRIVTVENLGPQSGVERLLATATEGANEVQRFEYHWDPATTQWSLVENGVLEKKQTDSPLAGGDRQRDIEVFDHQSGAPVLVSKTRERVHTYGWGEEVIQRVLDPAGVARTSAWGFWTDENTLSSYSQVQWHTEPDGRWETFEYDTTTGLVTRHRSGLGDVAFDSANPFAIADADCRVVETTWTGRNSVEVEKEGGVVVAQRYQDVVWTGSTEQSVTQYVCVKPTATKADTSNLVTTTVNFGASGDFALKPKKMTHPDGTLTTYTYSRDAGTGVVTTTVETGAPNGGGTAVTSGRKIVTVTNSVGQLLSEEVSDIATTLVVSSRTATAWDSFGRPTSITHEDGTTETFSYGCCGLESQTDRTSAITYYDYDDFKQVRETTRDDLGEIIERDAAGRVRFEKRRGTDNSVQTTRENRYNLAGELIETLDAMNRSTTIAETRDGSGRRVVTTTNPDGGTRIETFRLDGELWKVEGTAVAPMENVPGVASITVGGSAMNARFRKLIHVGEAGATTEWAKKYMDAAGRGVRIEHADSGVETMDYNDLGQLVKTVDPDGVMMLYTYNALGEREVEALDMDRDGVIDYDGTDRILKTTRSVVAHDGLHWERSVVQQWQTEGANTPTTIEQTDTTANGLATWTTRFGLTTKVVTTLQGGGAVTTTTTLPDNSSLIQTRAYGRPLTSTRKDSANVTLGSQTSGYADPFKRLKTVTDAGTGTTTFTYYADDQIETTTTPDPDGAGPDTAQVTTQFYDDAGRPWKRHLPDGADEFTEYEPTGAVKKRYGARTYPVEYTYDPQGRVRTLKTRQGEPDVNEAVTEWIYKADSGRLWKKKYQDNKFTEYSWSLGGRLATRKWARGIITTYTPDNAGETTSVDYDDSTPDVTRGYNRRGLLETMTDAAGTRTLTYWANGDLDDEVYTGTGTLSGYSVTRTPDAFLRKQTMQASGPGGALDSATSYGYDDASRLQTVSIGNLSATYTRSPNREVIGQIVFKNGATTVLTTTQGFDNLDRFKNVNSVTPASVTVSSASYGFNDANQRTRTDREDGTHWSYGYDDLGQVTSGSHKLSDETAILGEQFGYTFDRIGNRTQTVTNGQTATYTPNLLNQYDQRTVPGVMEIAGQAATDATVTVDGQRALRQGMRFFKSVPVDNSVAPVKQATDVLAVKNLVGPDNKDAVMTQSVSQYVPETPEIFSYDHDGNLTGDGQWAYTWDAENRLVAMERIAAAVTAGMPKRKLIFAYDGQSRRIEKNVYDWDAGMGSYELSTRTKFVYDRWNLLGETDGSDTVVCRYVWGLDLSGTERSAGGIGGLLFERFDGIDTIPCYDGNGNIIALTDANSGLKVASYEFTPFGDLLRSTGPAAGVNPIRWSTRYTDRETTLVVYPLRAYNPSIGRWLTRDLLAESGGINRYAMVENDIVMFFDPLGLAPVTKSVKVTLGWDLQDLHYPNGEDRKPHFLNKIDATITYTCSEPDGSGAPSVSLSYKGTKWGDTPGHFKISAIIQWNFDIETHADWSGVVESQSCPEGYVGTFGQTSVDLRVIQVTRRGIDLPIEWDDLPGDIERRTIVLAEKRVRLTCNTCKCKKKQ